MTWGQVFDRTTVAFATPEVQRVFLACLGCGRVKAHYDLYAHPKEPGRPLCRCGSAHFRPKHIGEIQAAWRLLVIGWLWRHLIRGYTQWDPRLPIRRAS